MKFSEWLIINESALPIRQRPEMSEMDIKKSEVSVGDIVELGPETKYKGKNVPRIGQIVHIRGYDAIIKDLTQGKTIAVSIDELYEKEELKGIRLTPTEEKQLSLLGGKKLWVKLSERQHKKYKSKYKVDMKAVMPDSVEPEPSKELSKMFSQKKSEPGEEKKLKIFEPSKASSKPLERFVNKRRGIF
jgi:hypothetical protein